MSTLGASSQDVEVNWRVDTNYICIWNTRYRTKYMNTKEQSAKQLKEQIGMDVDVTETLVASDFFRSRG